ncbi:MAG: pyruvate dehydrogenase (acetyl-transferring) E1 component subunit alpha [Bacteroidia bacterium]|nr:pyruvate dehydrogenase (acetyl-transferring) E1 component subunit alpha [Bacteroidia bacterium]
MAKTQTVKSNKYSTEQVLWWYEQMLLMRKFEEKAGQLYGMQKIKGFCHLYIGQEAVAAGIESAITPEDYVITAYREHGNALVRGVSANAAMAELFGKATGCSKGKGGSMHMFSKEHNFLGGHGIVGGQIPLGAGVAFAIKYRKEKKVCITMFGDGALRQGALHEAFNMASTWKLPVVFIVENNFYAMGTSVERTSNVTELSQIGAAYNMPSWQVDGMNVMSVHEEVSKAVQHAKAGNGPVFLEIRTYRYKGHSMSDPAKYRTKEELEKYKDLDPVAHIKNYIVENKIASDPEINLIEERIKLTVQESVTFAENSPFPEPEELYTDVYVQADYPFLMD